MRKQHGGSLAWTAVIVLGSAAVLGWAVLGKPGFIAATRAHGPAMAFLKFFFLGTLGAILKTGTSGRGWVLERGVLKALVWGVYGIWIGAAFAVFSGGVEAAVAHGWWFGQIPAALGKSLWINVIGGYAYLMMRSHILSDRVLDGGWSAALGTLVSPEEVRSRKYLWITIFLIWVPAHWFTFSQPEEWRVIIAAVLSVVLGFLLSLQSRPKAVPTSA